MEADRRVYLHLRAFSASTLWSTAKRTLYLPSSVADILKDVPRGIRVCGNRGRPKEFNSTPQKPSPPSRRPPDQL